MLKHKRRRQKTEVKEEESQKDLISGISGSDVREILNMEYGEGVVSLTVTTPPTLLARIQSVPALQKMNRSLAISFILHQGLARYMEKYEHGDAT